MHARKCQVFNYHEWDNVCTCGEHDRLRDILKDPSIRAMVDTYIKSDLAFYEFSDMVKLVKND